MVDDDKLRKSDLVQVEIALLSRGMRNPQFNRIMQPLRAALLHSKQQPMLLTKSAPDRPPGEDGRPPPQED